MPSRPTRVALVAQAQLEGACTLVDVLVHPAGGGPGPIVGMSVSQMLAILKQWLHVHNALSTFSQLEDDWRLQWVRSNHG